jgi:(S)-mandelate dehydrogenase
VSRNFRHRAPFHEALNIDELRAMAQRRLPGFAFEYIDGGAQDEVTLRWNRQVFESWKFIPDTLVDTSERHCRTQLFGTEIPAPLIVAPTGLNGMLCADGDIALARAASSLGLPFTLSTVSNVTIERLAQEVKGRQWMQLYVFRDQAITEAIVASAERSGCEALVLTSDANIFGSREWDRRNYRGPGKLRLGRMLDAAMHPRWIFDVLFPHGVPRFENVARFCPPNARSASAGVTLLPQLLRPNLCWDDLHLLRRLWPRKLILKGVLSAADASRAAELGCDGIVLTNHGGRQVDGCVSPLDVLPEVAAAVGAHLTIIVDSGFRRGTDVLKALALGAHAVMIGRAGLYGLAAGGEAGARHAYGLLLNEMQTALGQIGCRTVRDLGPHRLRPRTCRF